MIHKTEHIHRIKYDGRGKKPSNSRKTRMLLRVPVRAMQILAVAA